ncbi:4-hydroxybenzoate polyprenyl transferase [Auricularia subglabra TFB-10046 SS5]|nr:4-hydroxybenzoate polyprenyl transferase [Auricularia subglabra TFB-10046 SS5]
MSIIQPYLDLMRVGKPTGTWLIFWPFAWGLTLAARTVGTDLSTYSRDLFYCFAGAFVLRSCVCTLNDICDVDFDRKVERCKTRPLPSGRVSIPSAVVFFMVQLGMCVAALGRMNQAATLLGLIGLFPLHCTYPLFKRWTYWPQAWLGLAMNFGLPVAWAAYTGEVNVPLMSSMLLGAWCWTMVYDTIYACQDMKDDKAAGVKSTALVLGDYIRPAMTFLSGLFIACLAAAGILVNAGPLYYAIGVAGAALHITWQLATVDLEKPSSCWNMFASNAKLGGIVWAGLAADYVQSIWPVAV